LSDKLPFLAKTVDLEDPVFQESMRDMLIEQGFSYETTTLSVVKMSLFISAQLEDQVVDQGVITWMPIPGLNYIYNEYASYVFWPIDLAYAEWLLENEKEMHAIITTTVNRDIHRRLQLVSLIRVTIFVRVYITLVYSLSESRLLFFFLLVYSRMFVLI
jgi:hypothetical protein